MNTVEALKKLIAFVTGSGIEDNLVNKYGRMTNLGSSYKPVSDIDNKINWPVAGGVLSTSSTNVLGDSPTGAGVATALWSGLDVDLKEISEPIPIGGTGTKEFYRVHFGKVKDIGSAGDHDSSNLGDITAIHSGTNLPIAMIKAEEGSTLMAQYTVPAGYIGRISYIDARTESTSNIVARTRYRDLGDPVITGGIIDGDNATPYSRPFLPPRPLTPGTDFWVEAKVSTGSGAVSSSFDIVLEKI